MRVLHMIDSMGLGGAQVVVKGIFEGKKSDNIFLYALRRRNINIDINHKNIFYNNSTNKYTFPLLKLKKFIETNKIEVLHCHLAKSQVMGRVLKRFFFPKITLIFHEHGEIFQNGKIYPFLMNYCRSKVDLYLAVSRATKDNILRKTKFHAKCIKVLYNFVDLDKFEVTNGIEREKVFVFGFAGRIVRGKGWREFVKSAKKLSKKYKKIKFLMAGDGAEKDNLLDCISGCDTIEYLGYVNDMPGFYQKLDCFVSPTHREAMGLTILEANASGISVVVSDIEGLSEVVVDGESALLFSVGDVDDLTRKMEKIYNDNELQKKLVANGLNEVQKYSLRKYLVNLNSIYEKL